MITTIVNPEILLVLEKELDKYPTINTFLNNSNHSSGSLLTTSGLELIDSSVVGDLTMASECFSFLDTVSLLSMCYSGSATTFSHSLLEAVCNTRVIQNSKMCSSAAALTNHTANNIEEMMALMDNNPTVCAVVIFSILKRLFYK